MYGFPDRLSRFFHYTGTAFDTEFCSGGQRGSAILTDHDESSCWKYVRWDYPIQLHLFDIQNKRLYFYYTYCRSIVKYNVCGMNRIIMLSGRIFIDIIQSVKV
jgi:hypothetical protein